MALGNVKSWCQSGFKWCKWLCPHICIVCIFHSTNLWFMRVLQRQWYVCCCATIWSIKKLVSDDHFFISFGYCCCCCHECSIIMSTKAKDSVFWYHQIFDCFNDCGNCELFYFMEIIITICDSKSCTYFFLICFKSCTFYKKIHAFIFLHDVCQ